MHRSASRRALRSRGSSRSMKSLRPSSSASLLSRAASFRSMQWEEEEEEEAAELPSIHEISLRKEEFPGTKIGRKAILTARESLRAQSELKSHRRYMAARKKLPPPAKRITTNLPRWLLRRQDFQDAFRTSFRDEEALAALEAEPHMRNDQQINILLRWASSIKFFKEHLSAKARESLCKLLVLEKVKPGDVVCREGELGVTFYAIFKGRFTVNVKKLGDVHSLGPKDCFGEVALLSSDGKRNATITAATPGALVVLDKESYDSLLHMAHKRQTQTKLAFVHSLSLFDNVSKARVLQLCRLLDLRKMPQGSIVCRRGEKCESMFFVVRGWVDEIKYFKTAETNKWATDLSRTQFVENTQTRCVSAVVNQLGPKSYFGQECMLVKDPVYPSTMRCRSECHLLLLHLADLTGTVDVHTLNSLRERITVDPVTEEQYEKLCKTRFEMERLRHSLVTNIMTTKRVKKQPPTYLPTRTHIGGAYGRDAEPRKYNWQPEIDPVWVQFALDHHVKFEDALIPLERRVSTSHKLRMQRILPPPTPLRAQQQANDGSVTTKSHVSDVSSLNDKGLELFRDTEAERKRIEIKAQVLVPGARAARQSSGAESKSTRTRTLLTNNDSISEHPHEQSLTVSSGAGPLSIGARPDSVTPLHAPSPDFYFDEDDQRQRAPS